METRYRWRYVKSTKNFKMFFTLMLFYIVIVSQCNGLSRANDHHHLHTSAATTQYGHHSSDASPLRRDIASISVTEVNRSRNLRQAYENPLSYSEILPAHTYNHFHGDFDNSIERNSTDNRKPAFYACKDYAPKVKEEQPWNTFVIKVDAEDPDEYDTITYSFEKSANERAKFRINERSGEIVTSYTFDRDEPIREKEVSESSSSSSQKHIF